MVKESVNTADSTETKTKQIEHHPRGRNYNPLLNETASRSQVVNAFKDFWGEYETAVEQLLRLESGEWSPFKPSTFFEVSEQFVVDVLPEVKEVLFSMFMDELREQSVQAKARGFSDRATVQHKQLELTRLKWLALAQDYAEIDVERFVVKEMRGY